MDVVRAILSLEKEGESNTIRGQKIFLVTMSICSDRIGMGCSFKKLRHI